MRRLDPFEPLRIKQQDGIEPERQLAASAKKWNKPVRQTLRRLGDARWPQLRILGLIPVRRYRFRSRIAAGVREWWVEHDIPPYDRYRCAAYRVLLEDNGQYNPALVAQSGSGEYDVMPATIETLETVLARAGNDPPLVIPRAMGAARD